jgi:hypothetical protein
MAAGLENAVDLLQRPAVPRDGLHQPHGSDEVERIVFELECLGVANPKLHT